MDIDNGSDSLRGCDNSVETGQTWSVFNVDGWDIPRRVALTIMEHCRSYNQDGERRRRWAELR